MTERKTVTVRELIALLQALPAEQQECPVWSSGEAGCCLYEVFGIREVGMYGDNDRLRLTVVLDAE